VEYAKELAELEFIINGCIDAFASLGFSGFFFKIVHAQILY
jgi:hypothetical protein